MAQWVPIFIACLYSLGAYFHMDASTQEAVVHSGYGCLYSWGAYSQRVPIIPIIWYGYMLVYMYMYRSRSSVCGVEIFVVEAGPRIFHTRNL